MDCPRLQNFPLPKRLLQRSRIVAHRIRTEPVPIPLDQSHPVFEPIPERIEGLTAPN